MVKLDLKDRKILYQLDINCRQSNTQFGKKVGLSKQVVDYRIKRMEEDGVIKCYWTDIDMIGYGGPCPSRTHHRGCTINGDLWLDSYDNL